MIAATIRATAIAALVGALACIGWIVPQPAHAGTADAIIENNKINQQPRPAQPPKLDPNAPFQPSAVGCFGQRCRNGRLASCRRVSGHCRCRPVRPFRRC
jgi:hypothetical protein